MTATQIYNRNHFLDILKEYAASGVFPKNIYHQNRQPYFVDHLETVIRERAEQLVSERAAAEEQIILRST